MGYFLTFSYVSKSRFSPSVEFAAPRAGERFSLSRYRHSGSECNSQHEPSVFAEASLGGRAEVRRYPGHTANIRLFGRGRSRGELFASARMVVGALRSRASRRTLALVRYLGGAPGRPGQKGALKSNTIRAGHSLVAVSGEEIGRLVLNAQRCKRGDQRIDYLIDLSAYKPQLEVHFPS